MKMASAPVVTEERPANLPALTPEGELFNLRQRQARMFAMSPLVPEHLRKGTPDQAIANCWIALTLAEAMGEVPLIVMQNIHVVSGKAGFASQYMIARANNSGIFKGRIDWRIDKSDPDNLSVTAYAVLKETLQEVSVTCDMKMAKAEKWTRNEKYTTMPEVMLRYRSAAFLVRFYAPDVMLGYQTVEEVDDVSAAAAPAAPALTAQMLVDQSLPGTDSEPGEEENEQENGDQAERDHNGGMTLAESEERGEEPNAEVPTVDAEVVDENADIGGTSLAEQIADRADEAHPGKAIADKIIAEIEAPETNAIMDVASILNRHALDMQSMLDEDAVRIEVAADKRRNAIRAEQAKEPAE
jgi:hypothetical protein